MIDCVYIGNYIYFYAYNFINIICYELKKKMYLVMLKLNINIKF